MKHLKLEWKVLDDGRIALIFDAQTFSAYQTEADGRDVDTCEMIGAAVLDILGNVIDVRDKRS